MESQSVRPMSVRRGAEIGYRPALDGLRAVAVLAVMLYHAGVGWARGGFLGVDVFFVLSGFLITLLLLREWDRTGRLDLRAFWLRRARRLLPALFVVLVAVAGYALFLPPAQQQVIRGDTFATLAYVSNWWFIAEGSSYFARFVEASPLRHTWSLAIEEQFYLLFPLILGLALRRLSSRAALRAALVLGSLASAVLMAALHDPAADPSRAYYGTDTRLQGLLLGAALATALPARATAVGPMYGRVLGRLVPLSWTGPAWLGLAGLAVLTARAHELSPAMYRGGFLLAAALTCLVVAGVSLSPESSLARVLSVRPLVAVGVVSYGLYLWHWPVFVVLTAERTGLSEPWLLLVRFAVTGLLAVASYRFVEEPIRTRRLQARFTRTQWRRTVSVATAGLVALTLAATSPLLPQPSPPQAMAVGGAVASPTPDAQGRVVRAFLLGDSQSFRLRQHYAQQVPGLAVSGSTQLGCGTLLAELYVDGQTRPNLPACVEWEPRWTQEVADQRPDVVVLMLGLGDLFDRSVSGEVLRFGTAEHRAWLFGEIDRRVALVGDHAGTFALATVLCMRVRQSAGSDARIANDPQRLASLNEAIREYGAAHPAVRVVELHDTICRDGYVEALEGVALRDDGLHLTQEGAGLVWERFGPLVQAATPVIAGPAAS